MLFDKATIKGLGLQVLGWDAFFWDEKGGLSTYCISRPSTIKLIYRKCCCLMIIYLSNSLEHFPHFTVIKINYSHPRQTKNMREFENKTVFITGASRGIGKAIGERLAKEGANIVIAAKTAQPHPKLEGTIYTAAEDMVKAGGQALPVVVDIREEELVQAAIDKAVEHFGGIDILINNASAINLSNTEDLPMKRYDLMHSVNARGTFLTTKLCLPFLKKGNNPHVLNLSPPLNMNPKWFGGHVAYTMAKYGMSMCVLGQAEEFKPHGIGVNALWPRTTIDTAAVRNLLGGAEMAEKSRTPEIIADAAYYILRRSGKECTGNFFIDDEVMAEEGITDLKKYAVNPTKELMPDFFV